MRSPKTPRFVATAIPAVIDRSGRMMARSKELISLQGGSHSLDFSSAILYFSEDFEKKFQPKKILHAGNFCKSWTKKLNDSLKIVSFEGGGRTENQKPIGFTFREKNRENRIFRAPANFELA